jgi:acyl-CoA thioesterase-2
MDSDVDFLGLVPSEAPGRFSFQVIDRLARLDGRLYGGTAIAVSVAVSELVSERSALWMTTQFVSTVEFGATMDVHAEVLAGGRRTNQVRVTGTSTAGEVVFASLGATGIYRPDGLTGAFETCPTVQTPDESERWDSPFSGLVKAAGFTDDQLPRSTTGFGVAVEMREPEIIEHPEPGPGRICLWVRRRDGVAVTPAVAAYLADVVPMGIAHALGVVAGGTSLDNTIRIGPFVDTEWVLLDLRPHLAVGGYGHGIAHVWSENGDLLATASQTASMIEFDLSHLADLLGPDTDTPT